MEIPAKDKARATSAWPLVCSDLGSVLAWSWGLQSLQLTEEEWNIRALQGVHSHHRGQQLPQC